MRPSLNARPREHDFATMILGVPSAPQPVPERRASAGTDPPDRSGGTPAAGEWRPDQGGCYSEARLDPWMRWANLAKCLG